VLAMLTYTRPTIDDLLGTSIASLDIPEEVRRVAVARYQAVASSLESRWQSGVIYPQGSFRLGTTVRPIHAGGEYDIDLVCRREIAKTSTTQRALKAEVGAALTAFVASGPEGAPTLSEGKRCWTLNYPNDPFHLDSLPAVPDENAIPHGILLTDRELHAWQYSNPIAYSDWFYVVMAKEFAERRTLLAKQMQVDDVPDWRVKTTLQRAVQALKRHRDIYFVERADEAPASIIITTLAGRAYDGPGDLFDGLISIVNAMPHFVEVREGVYWVANPVQPQENFADRWKANPKRATAFFEWIEVAQRDFASIADVVGIDRVLTRIAKTFGEDAARGGGSALGVDYRSARDHGDLKMTPGTGALAVASSGIGVQGHTFHGEST
jgi:hypothetical protein